MTQSKQEETDSTVPLLSESQDNDTSSTHYPGLSDTHYGTYNTHNHPNDNHRRNSYHHDHNDNDDHHHFGSHLYGTESTSHSRQSLVYNDAYIAQNFASALPPHVLQKIHRQSIISPLSTPRGTMSRVENLSEMRPFHLVGLSEPFCDWQEYYKDEDFIKGLKNKELREYYTRQNELIDRYSEIDRMLGTGFQIDMLREYGSDLHEMAGSNKNNSQHSSDHGSEHDPQSDNGNGGNNNNSNNNLNSGGEISTSSAKTKLTPRQGVPYKMDEEAGLIGGRNEEDHSNLIMLAIYVNFAINIVLLIGKIIVALLTNSLTVIASLVDSVLDFLSTAIIWASSRLISVRDWKTKHLYPVGRSRLEPIGVLVFSVLIIVSFFQVGDEAIQRLLWGKHETVLIGWSSVGIMALTVVTKFFCYLWCKTIESSAVEALAQDAMTDVVFNTISIAMPMLGHYLDLWWIDPLAALGLACYISWTWGETALEHIDNLTGATADPEDRQVLLYLCARFADTIQAVTALNAYHSGDRLTVEVDIALDAESSLRDCHDIGEALQYALETLPFVERAFVHLDYRAGNFAGHVIN